MGYPKDLDEYTDEELRGELSKRSKMRERNLCSYCGQAIARRGVDESKRCRLHEMSTGATGSFWTAKRWPWDEKDPSDVSVMVEICDQ